MEFYCVATDISTGSAVYHRCTGEVADDLNWIRASAAMPLVSRPVEIDGGKYLDGGGSDSIPLRFMEEKGYDRILVIETQPADYVKMPQKFMPVVKLMLRDYPEMINCLEKRHLMYNEEKYYIRNREKSGDVLVIRPGAPLNISPIEKNPDEIERVYRLGRDAALESLGRIREFFYIS
jgi:predicted patatin/cPLA2 family phospholipase